MTVAAFQVLPAARRAEVHQQLALLERAGVAVIQAVGMLRLPGEQARVAKTQRGLEQGLDLAEAGIRAGLFAPFEARVLAAALQAGSPALAHERLGAAAAAQSRRASQLRARLAMPAFVFAVSLFVQPLPALIAGSISGGSYLAQTVGVLLELAVLLALAGHLLRRFGSTGEGMGRLVVETVAINVPIVGPMLVRSQAQVFFENLALLLASGVSMFDALPTAASTLWMRAVRVQFEGLLPQMQAGATLANAARSLGCLGNREVIGMLATGEASGRLPELLAHYARAEGVEIASMQDQFATWLPRIIYAAIALWMAAGLIAGAGAVMGRRNLE